MKWERLFRYNRYMGRFLKTSENSTYPYNLRPNKHLWEILVRHECVIPTHAMLGSPELMIYAITLERNDSAWHATPARTCIRKCKHARMHANMSGILPRKPTWTHAASLRASAHTCTQPDTHKNVHQCVQSRARTSSLKHWQSDTSAHSRIKTPQHSTAQVHKSAHLQALALTSAHARMQAYTSVLRGNVHIQAHIRRRTQMHIRAHVRTTHADHSSYGCRCERHRWHADSTARKRAAADACTQEDRCTYMRMHAYWWTSI